MANQVTVACKLPAGIELQLYDMVAAQEPVMGGGYREFKRATPKGKPVRLRGWNQPGTKVALPANAGEFAFTQVDEGFWTEWLAQNNGAPMLENGIVFALGKPGDAQAKAKEFAKVRSGLEPLDPAKPPVEGIETLVRETA